MSREERLTEFIQWWRDNITGDEKGEAQIFLDRLLQACGHPGALEVGRYEERVPRKKRHNKTTVSFADYVMRDTVLIEMKKRGENLAKHYDQLEDYWKGLTDKPRYALLCNFDEIWIYSFPTQFYDPVDFVKIEELVERADALEFLFAGSYKTPVFRNNLIEVTKDAAFSLSKIFRSLDKRKVDTQIAQHYVLQCMLALFSEDIGLLPSAIFARIIDYCLKNDEGDFSPRSYDLIKQLFMTMNTPGIEQYGMFYEVDYFNGGIFSDISPIPLSKTELIDMREASRQNWSKIKPAIFGTIFEESMNKDERHQIGAHFTNEHDIKLIIDPVIVNPWDERIEAANVADLKLLHAELCDYKVLDPACGSGNFLYIAYIEMKKLEQRLFDRLRGLDATLPENRVSVKQFYGMDINSFAVELAKVTMMIAKKIAVDVTGSDENPLPLDNMDDNIVQADALFTDWVDFDACIGNPPYFGAKRLKQEHPASYINQIRKPLIPTVHGQCRLLALAGFAKLIL
ncbi:MAG: N-6 DNA methylase [Anaerolineae bacterium]|nr:N-6 DNA methylase [Anaerolineae bacterium]